MWVSEHTVSRAGGPSGGQVRPLVPAQRSSSLARWIAPNASCPVCGAAVYFYANEYGSRVYFDELGPPWPKHPCTSQHELARVVPAGSVVPTVRHGGGGGMPALTRLGRPLVVELVRPGARGTLLRLRSLQPGGQAKIWRSDKDLAVSSGQIVFVSADVMSYIDMARMEPASAPLRYLNGYTDPLLQRIFGFLGR